MTKDTRKNEVEAKPEWDHLEEWLRRKMQKAIQEVLEDEVTEFLGRAKSQRRAAVDAVPGYRNGYGKQRRLTLSCGTVVLRRPRVRDIEERFESRLLPLFARRTKEVSDLLPQLYLHGLAEGDFDLALRGLLGEEAPLSASTIARLKAKWQGEWETWNARRLDDLEPVYLWVDGVYVKAGLEKEKAALLVVLAGLSDGRKVVLCVVPGHRESTASWASVLRDLKARGLRCPKAVVGDGHLGIWGALRQVYPDAEEQRCWNHRFLNVQDALPKKAQPAAKELLRKIAYAPSRQAAEAAKGEFARWAKRGGYTVAARLLDEDWQRMVTFFNFPKEHWIHLRTTNPIESPFAALRLRTEAAKRYKSVPNATALIWKMLLIAESRFRCLNAPNLLKEVYKGTRFVDGIKVNKHSAKKVAA